MYEILREAVDHLTIPFPFKISVHRDLALSAFTLLVNKSNQLSE